MSNAVQASEAFVPHPGAVVADKYELVRRLGAGGMGEVWSARHQALGHELAVKFLLPGADADAYEHDAMLSRFQLEARLAANLSRRSPHIASVTDFGMEGATAYLVMELLEGVCLDAVIARGAHIELDFVATVIAQLALGLATAHAYGVAHRDLKPSNIMLVKGAEPGRPLAKILDFGIGKLAGDHAAKAPKHRAPALVRHQTRLGEPLGTPEYMSPEQVRARGDVDFRCDIWALAVVAYEMLAGVCPFEGASIGETMSHVLTRSGYSILVHRPDLPPAASQLFETAFAFDLADRFPSAVAFAAALNSLAATAEPAASPHYLGAVSISVRTDEGASHASRVRPRKTTEPEF